MKPLWWILATTLLPLLAIAEEPSFWGFDDAARFPYHGHLWKAKLTDGGPDSYARETEKLIQAFENASGKSLEPGQHRMAALKIYTSSGAGMNTPRALVTSVIESLERRGFNRDEIFIVDAREAMLRESGFLPLLSKMPMMGPYFEGVRVYALDSTELQSPTWFYESPLPQEFTTPLGRILLNRPFQLDPVEARKSYLPDKLLVDVDFWINLPMASHHPATGLSGALVNATLWNITNGTRFFNSPANAPVAVAEIASIPELKASWALNIISLERYQYIAGPAFNANYTEGLPEIWMSVDPVVMDANLITLFNNARAGKRFEELPVIPEFIEYSIELGLGQGIPSETIVHSPAPASKD